MNCPEFEKESLEEELSGNELPDKQFPEKELDAEALSGQPLHASGHAQADLPPSNTEQETQADEVEASAWRDELSVRLTRYRARRRMPAPRYPSLRLQFDAYRPLQDSPENVKTQAGESVFEPASDRALALDMTVPGPHAGVEASLFEDQVQAAASPVISSPVAPARPSAKIIEFPKIESARFAWESFEPPPSPPDQLAGPVLDRPRILEVPEFSPLPPALGGITIEPVERQEAEKRLGIDIPLQSASLARRILACLIDGLIVGFAGGLFGYIFWRVAAVRPPLAQIAGVAVGGLLTFWAAYQYLLVVYAATTPGILAAGLELAHFDGSLTGRSLRRWRVLASFLSCASLGMGYAWVFLDEDVLCWHDRITRTYLAPRKRGANQKAA